MFNSCRKNLHNPGASAPKETGPLKQGHSVGLSPSAKGRGVRPPHPSPPHVCPTNITRPRPHPRAPRDTQEARKCRGRLPAHPPHRRNPFELLQVSPFGPEQLLRSAAALALPAGPPLRRGAAAVPERVRSGGAHPREDGSVAGSALDRPGAHRREREPILAPPPFSGKLAGSARAAPRSLPPAFKRPPSAAPSGVTREGGWTARASFLR